HLSRAEAVGSRREGGRQGRPRIGRRRTRSRQDRGRPGRAGRDGAGQAPLQDEDVHRRRQEGRLRDRCPQRRPRRSEGVLNAVSPTRTRRRAGRCVTDASRSVLLAASHTKGRRRVLPILEVVMLAIAALAPLVLQDYLTVYATRVLILCLFALSFDLVWGYAGIMSFGQSLFFGMAGYGVALLSRDLDVASIFAVIPAGILIGFVAAFLLGGCLLLGRHPSSVIFVALGTMTGAYAADRLARGWYYLGGQNGIPSIQSMTIGSYELNAGPVFYYLALGILVVVYLLCRFLMRSQFGLALAGLRENEQRIAFFGYKVQHLKAIIFTLSGAIAGLAGSLYAFHEGFV